MFVVTAKTLDVLGLAAGVTTLRRRLQRIVAATADKVEYSQLRSEIVNHGSSWAAMSWCLASRPINLAELLQDVGVGDLAGSRRRAAFNACADGYAVFDDGRTRCKV